MQLEILSCSRCRMYLSCSESLLRNYLLTSTPFVCLCKFCFLIAKFFFFFWASFLKFLMNQNSKLFQKVSTTFYYNDDKLCGVTTYYYTSLFFFFTHRRGVAGSVTTSACSPSSPFRQSLDPTILSTRFTVTGIG